jgi:hypothetical protein
MGFILANLKRGLPLAALAWTAGFLVPAQGSEPRQGQPILFSSPAGDDVDTNNLPSLSPKPAEALDIEGIAHTPDFNFNNVRNPMPLAPGPGFYGESAEQQDRRRNWTLLTPAEILGAATPEKIMGISERDAFGRAKNLTALERYTERQNQLQLRLAKTNALLAGEISSAWNFSGDPYGMSNSISGGWRNPEYPANSLFGSAPDRQAQSRQKENSAWSRLFDQPSALPAPNLAQQANMERFRQMLNPESSPITPATAASADGIKTTLPQSMLGSSLAQAAAPRFAASFTPLSSGVSRPPALPKLPAAWSLGYTSAPPAAVWSPQQAPWLAPGPQPFVAPQRKF